MNLLPQTEKRWVAVIVCLPLGGRVPKSVVYKAGTHKEMKEALASARILAQTSHMYVTGYITQSLRKARYYRGLWRKGAHIPAPMLGVPYDWKQIQALSAINIDYKIAEGKLWNEDVSSLVPGAFQEEEERLRV